MDGIRLGFNLADSAARANVPVSKVLAFFHLGMSEVRARNREPGTMTYELEHDFYTEVIVQMSLHAATQFHTLPIPEVIEDVSWSRMCQIARGDRVTQHEKFLGEAHDRAMFGVGLEDVAGTLGVSVEFSGLKDAVSIGQHAFRAAVSTSLGRLAKDGDVKACMAWLEALDERFKPKLGGNPPLMLTVVHRMV